MAPDIYRCMTDIKHLEIKAEPVLTFFFSAPVVQASINQTYASIVCLLTVDLYFCVKSVL